MVEAHASPGEARDYSPQKVEDARKGILPPGTELHLMNRGDRGEEYLLLSKQTVFTGDDLTRADPTPDQQGGTGWLVNIALNSRGGNAMKETTREGVKRRMAVVLIEKGKAEVLTAPVIQSELSNSFHISGMRNAEEANTLALLMRAGSLAAPMEIIEERTIGPSLGAENIGKGLNSVMYGFAAIALFMCAYYLLFGMFSTLALAFNLLMLIAVLSLMQATLSLPGIAAIALALGMAIDSNVLIKAAIAAGYERAWATILDSNITTLIAGLALLAFGSGPIRGFAMVHCLGIMTSMFSAVMFSRGLVNLWYGRQKKLKSVSIGQVWRPEGALPPAADNQA
jgi:preprotein translocase subunit SecD